MTTAPEASSAEQLLLARHLVDRLVSRASGRAEQECLRNYPRDAYFIGNLRSQDGTDAQAGLAPHMPELINKLSPVAFGAHFRLRPDDGTTMRIKLTWACYYRVFPTLDQQGEHQQGPNRPRPQSEALRPANAVPVGDGEDDTDEDGDEPAEAEASGALEHELRQAPDEVVTSAAVPRGGGNTPGGRRSDTLMLRFRKIDCDAEGDISVERGPSGTWTLDHHQLQEAIEASLLNARALVEADPEAFKTTADVHAQIRVPENALGSEQQYRAFLSTLTVPVRPVWRWQLRFDTEVDGHDATLIVLSTVFANDTSRQLSADRKDNPNLEHYLFDTAASYAFQSGEVVPFEINAAPQGFRFDRHVPARGFNCAVVGTDHYFQTTHVPVYDQARYQTQSTPEAPFGGLAVNPLPILDNILQAMEDYRSEWDDAFAEFEQSLPNWNAVHAQEFERDRRTFDEEIEGFRRGRDLIRDNADVRLAFQLTNETFRRGPRTNWRLFQIVFLVSQVSGIASLGNVPGANPDDLNRADIIYFPTGGGKTEAYLGVLVFHCFFDRLRGKVAGVTAWIRFPLRLLTLQQTQRVADVVCVAEIVRREQTNEPRLSGRGVAGFAVGYFVGKTSTPNELVDMNKYRYEGAEYLATWHVAADVSARQRWKRLIQCPSCRTSTVTVTLDTDRVRLIHRCTNDRCAFPQGTIPVYVVDNEVYRYLPSVIVGTIDKLAGVGNQRKMAQIFGSVDGFCQTHGYYKGKCCQRECDNRNLGTTVPSGLSGPTLFMQDELHLLKEGLGTFDSHYETFVQELLRELNPGSKLKIIASSATIENFQRQVKHLYDADPNRARMFPGPGPRLGQSFYAESRDYPQRIYVGVIPHNKTIFNAILELLELYHASVQDLIDLPAGQSNPYGGSVQPHSPSWFNLFDLYVTSLTYFLKGRDLNSVHTDVDGHVTPSLQSSGRSFIDVRELTGSTTTDEVARTLEHLQRPKPAEERSTAVLATSMVSHGVDIDRLNAMFFYGMPRQNAEYIQASSRVGRANVGIVFVCHHPARERDQSHYGLFGKFHEYLGQLVEPVAINRWAKFSINRTLPGLFMGVLLQLVANRANPRDVNKYLRTDHVRRLYTSGAITADDFIPFLEEAYRVTNPQDVAAQTFRTEIRLRVQQFFDQIIQAGASQQWVSDALIPRPMTSLRDIDEPIPIHLDQDGAAWSSRQGS